LIQESFGKGARGLGNNLDRTLGDPAKRVALPVNFEVEAGVRPKGF
jgi:hypothetical protein